MFRALTISLLTITILVGSSQQALSQDSVDVVILSSKVGPVIDAREREYFHLFAQIEGFQSAQIVRTSLSTFEARILCIGTSGMISAKTLPYNNALLMQMAEKVEHFEELESGTYALGSKPARLQVVNSKSLRSEEMTLAVAQRQEAIIRARAQLPNVKPDPPIELQSYPRLRIGVGLSGYSPNTDAVTSLLNRIEETARVQGYPVGTNAIRPDISSLYGFTLGVDITDYISVELETGRSTGGDVFTLKTASLSLFCYLNSLRIAFLRPFLGVGVANYNLSAEHKYNYNARMATDSMGGYWEFSSVWFEGNSQATAPIVVAGLETTPTKGSIGLALRLGAKYVDCPGISVSASGNPPVAIDMKRFSFGVNLLFYF